ncbi:hypothetical protein [Dyadobacter fanqingshengii]|uniref:Uncharacterized protein n=1 Tax=Dyadobacter fanqingshengii TaxID=2906443 RepID=A0A9X1P8R5_9BACT|nr:hypothetical protein [Dyadobacter fanqingshengii]MCF0039749.1 hypothetical protein [Dyadobacter fanqingshengii]USJ38489.1 hypothetical protein NFI81_12050 [Dyadobacter fanqingshengii]
MRFWPGSRAVVFEAILDLIQAYIPALSLFGKGFGTISLIAKAFVVGLIDTVSNAGKAFFFLG